MEISLKGKKVFISGAAEGIGRATAFYMLKLGAQVTICDINEEKLSSMGKEIQTFVCDVSDSKAVDQIFKQIENSGLDILVNNAAIQPTTSLENITEKEVSEMLTINLATPLLLIQAFSKQKIDNGSVVNISSIEAIRPAINHSHYASTKAGLLN